MAISSIDADSRRARRICSSSRAGGPDPPPSTRTWRPADKVTGDDKPRRILIVDDDPQVLEMVALMAGCLGFSTHTAGDAMAALLQLEKMHVDLVLTDYKMPRINGGQLAVQIRKKWPGTKVVIMTGHCEQTVTDMLKGSDAVDGLLLKPFNLQAMKDKIECAGDCYLDRLAP